MTKIAFIGAGSTIFMKNIVGDALHFDALRDAHIALMDIDPTRLAESELVANKLIAAMDAPAPGHRHHRPPRARSTGPISSSPPSRSAATSPATVIDFDIPTHYGLRQTIADTLGVGGIMRGLRTVPHLWDVAEDMAQVCPDAHDAAIRQPDGDQHLGAGRTLSPPQTGRALPFRAEHGRGTRPRPRPAEGRDPLPRRRRQPRGVLPARCTSRCNGAARSTRRCATATMRARLPKPPLHDAALPQQGTLRGADAPRLLLHRKLRTPRRIRPVVHQGRRAPT